VLIASMHGPITVTAGLARAEQMRGQVEGDHRLKATVMRARALFEAMRGNFDVARDLVAAAVALAEQLGLEVEASNAQSDTAEIELLAGRPAEAERVLRVAVDALQRRGDVGHLATVAPLLADVLYRQGRPDEAMSLTELVARSALAEDLDPQVAWRRVQAKLVAQRGDFDDAVRLAREAIALAERSDYLDLHARAIEDLVEVLRLAGRSQAALGELEPAILLHEQKGNIVAVARTRALRELLASA
jgi:tetratricopeptide (TPR) repeat protein